jgi:hypothetical protein
LTFVTALSILLVALNDREFPASSVLAGAIGIVVAPALAALWISAAIQLARVPDAAPGVVVPAASWCAALLGAVVAAASLTSPGQDLSGFGVGILLVVVVSPYLRPSAGGAGST